MRQKSFRWARVNQMFQDMETVNQKYSGQWVFLINCVEETNGSVVGGEVVLHNENREAVLQKMPKYEHEKSLTLFRYAGDIPKDVHVIL
ncbi:MAG: hypothetical protein LBN34_05035 [Clostridiales Family XIII bacterium]|jgi:hypothetical protein|nr:hypothetical protein [Clostridiales Family XIII bacterium]